MIKEITRQEEVDNTHIREYMMKNEHLEVRFLNIGGALTKIAMQHDNYNENLVLAYHHLKDYLNNTCYLNTIIGRTSNRIKDGQFPLNDKTIQVDLNDGRNNLHGGSDCLVHHYFEVEPINEGYRLKATLPHQENGFPGNVTVQVDYTLKNNKLNINYKATTDQDTIVNLTQHTYFNLSGNLKTNIYNHKLQIIANQVAEVDENSSFTTKEILVTDTLFDFRQPTTINHNTKKRHSLFEKTDGYDHLYLLNGKQDEKQANILFSDPESGRSLKISTTEPAVQFYAGNHIAGNLIFEHHRQGEKNLGACFETHKIPYDFQSQIIKPGDIYQQQTTFEFTKI